MVDVVSCFDYSCSWCFRVQKINIIMISWKVISISWIMNGTWDLEREYFLASTSRIPVQWSPWSQDFPLTFQVPGAKFWSQFVPSWPVLKGIGQLWEKPSNVGSPNVVIWFMNPMKTILTSIKNHRRYVHQLWYRQAPHCRKSFPMILWHTHTVVGFIFDASWMTRILSTRAIGGMASL